MAKIDVKNLYKIFGTRPHEVLKHAKKGVPKDEILTKTGHTVGLTDISLSIEAQETFVVMGLSGCGKSTFIRCINRLIEPTAGEISIDGRDVLALNKSAVKALRREKMGMVFQRFALFPHKTVLQNVAYGLNVQGVAKDERQERALHWINAVGLDGYEHARPNQLSGGMQQRVGLARALCTDPEILLMDEAFSALDPLIRREMQDELIRLQKELHKTIIFITHDLDEALRLGDRVAILKDGRLIQVGTPIEIVTNPADDYVRAFVRDVNRARVLTAKSIMEKTETLPIHTSPREAAKIMTLQHRALGVVVDNDHRYRGIVSMAEASAAIKRGENDLQGVVKERAPTIGPDTYLTDLLSLSADSAEPIVVLDDGDLYLGTLSRSAVLTALAGKSDIDENHIGSDSKGLVETPEDTGAAG